MNEVFSVYYDFSVMVRNFRAKFFALHAEKSSEIFATEFLPIITHLEDSDDWIKKKQKHTKLNGGGGRWGPTRNENLFKKFSFKW